MSIYNFPPLSCLLYSNPCVFPSRPVLFPCRHYLACQPCLSYQGSPVLCPQCNEEIDRGLQADEWIGEILAKAQREIAQGTSLEQVEKQIQGLIEERYSRRNVKRAMTPLIAEEEKKNERSPAQFIDISSLPFIQVLESPQGNFFHCFVCNQDMPMAEEECRTCHRLNFQQLATKAPPLPADIEAACPPIVGVATQPSAGACAWMFTNIRDIPNHEIKWIASVFADSGQMETRAGQESRSSAPASEED